MSKEEPTDEELDDLAFALAVEMWEAEHNTKLTEEQKTQWHNKVLALEAMEKDIDPTWSGWDPP